MDYLEKGLNLSLIGAIDFTASNKPVNNPESLHYLNPNGELNKY